MEQKEMNYFLKNAIKVFEEKHNCVLTIIEYENSIIVKYEEARKLFLRETKKFSEYGFPADEKYYKKLCAEMLEICILYLQRYENAKEREVVTVMMNCLTEVMRYGREKKTYATYPYSVYIVVQALYLWNKKRFAEIPDMATSIGLINPLEHFNNILDYIQYWVDGGSKEQEE